jgi:hypothetical protein
MLDGINLFLSKYLGRIESNKLDVRFFQSPAPAADPGQSDQKTSEELVCPGLVMEFLEGPTVTQFLIVNQNNAKQRLCFLAQMISLFDKETAKGRFNLDLHGENAIVMVQRDDVFTLTKSTKCKRI